MNILLLSLLVLCLTFSSSSQVDSPQRIYKDRLKMEDSVAYKAHIDSFIYKKVKRKDIHVKRVTLEKDHRIFYYFIGRDTIRNVLEIFHPSHTDSIRLSYYHYGFNFKDGKVVTIAKLAYITGAKNKQQRTYAFYYLKDDQVVLRKEDKTTIPDWEIQLRRAYELKEMFNSSDAKQE